MSRRPPRELQARLSAWGLGGRAKARAARAAQETSQLEPAAPPEPVDAASEQMERAASVDERALLRDEVAGLREEVARLNDHRWLRIHNSMGRLVMFQLYRGLAFGLGTVLGATVVLSLVVWSLSQINFIPVIGDWAAQILEVIEPTMDRPGD